MNRTAANCLIPLLPPPIRALDVRKLLATALDAWQQRDDLVEQHKNDCAIACFWVKYNDLTRELNPLPQLKELGR